MLTVEFLFLHLFLFIKVLIIIALLLIKTSVPDLENVVIIISFQDIHKLSLKTH